MNTPSVTNGQLLSDGVSSQAMLCLSNARLVLKERVIHGYISVVDGVIQELGEGRHVPAGAVDCAGDHVIPGLVELHTDNLERHLEPRPGVNWPHLSAILAHDAELASTGITTCLLYTSPSPRDRTRSRMPSSA